MSSRDPDDRGAPPPRPPVPVGDAAQAVDDAPQETVSIDSATLFGRASEVRIAHRGAVYRLKQTSLGKLILTK